MSNIKTQVVSLWKQISDAYDRAEATGKYVKGNYFRLNCNPLYQPDKTVADTYKDYVKCNYNLKLCDNDTQRIYKNLYSKIRNTNKRNKQNSMEAAMHNLIDRDLSKIFDEMGFGWCEYNEVYRVTDTHKCLQYLFDNIINPKLIEKGLAGVKLRRNASIGGYKLFDFTDAEIKQSNSNQKKLFYFI